MDEFVSCYKGNCDKKGIEDFKERIIWWLKVLKEMGEFNTGMRAKLWEKKELLWIGRERNKSFLLINELST